MERRLAAALASLAIALIGCGSQGASDLTPSSGSPRAAGATSEHSDRLFALTGGRILAVDAATGETTRTIEGALVAPDWSAIYAVIQRPGSAAVRVSDPATGNLIREIAVPAGFDLPAYGSAPDGLSADGQWLVLTAAGRPGATQSRFAIVDTRAGKANPPITLDGDYAFDAISNDGALLYLVEHPTPDPTRYRVRIYDRRIGVLVEQVVADKTVSPPDGLMRGIYATSVAGPHGEWNFSLYFNPAKGPFVHALNLQAQYAQCILDVPAGSGAAASRGLWSLAKSPNGAMVYAVNGDLGTVAAIDTSSVKVVGSATLPGTPAGSDRQISHGAVVSPDGMRLYAVGATGVLALNAGDLSVRGRYITDRIVDSLALSADGARLYALSRDTGMLWRVDASTGRPLDGSPLAGVSALLRVGSGRD